MSYRNSVNGLGCAVVRNRICGRGFRELVFYFMGFSPRFLRLRLPSKSKKSNLKDADYIGCFAKINKNFHFSTIFFTKKNMKNREDFLKSVLIGVNLWLKIVSGRAWSPGRR